MKKTKVLIATLALSAALMGTGYAYWTKELTVDTTVQSAKFDVYFSAATASTTDGTNVNNTQNKIDNAVTSEKKDNITYKWSNIYPGSKATLSFTIQNDSTIPVHAKPVIDITSKDNGKGNQKLQEMLTYTVSIDGTQVTTGTLAQVESALEAMDKTIIATGSMIVDVIVELPSTVTEIDAENDEIVINAKMTWRQFNDQDPTPPETTPADTTTPLETTPAS